MTEAQNTLLAGAHHALLCMGNRERILQTLESELGVAFTHVADPDISFRVFASCGIEDVRALTQDASRAPIARETVTFIIVASDMTLPAQNALLKLTEDPPKSARFIFVLPKGEYILPTLLSRLVVRTQDSEVLAISVDGMTHGECILTIAEAVKKDEETAWVEGVLATLEQKVSESPATLRVVGENLLHTRRHITKSGASPKMLLENLMLSYFESRKSVKN